MSLTNREIFRAARINLTNVYRVGMAAFLLANITTFAIELPFQSLEVANPNMVQRITSLAVTFLIALLSLLLTVGQYSIHLQLARPEETKLPNTFQVFYCFKNHPDRYIVCGFLLMLMFGLCLIPTGIGYYMYSQNEETILLPIIAILAILSIIGIFFVLIRFSFAFFLLLDQQDLSVMDSFRQSLSLTQGQCKQLLVIFLYFAGLDLLSALSFGFAMLWVVPYEIQILSVCYLDLAGELSSQPGNTPTIDIVIE